ALRMAQDGHHVALNFARNEALARAVLERIIEAGGSGSLVQFDVTNREETLLALDELLSNHPIHVLVNNAGVARDMPFPVMEEEAWLRVTRTTLDGFYNVTQPLVMPMVRARFGRIVNISSISGVLGNRGQVNYSAAKAGLIGATKALAQEMAKRNVTVNAVAPGPVETDMFQGALAQGTPLDEVLKHIPMRRIGKVEDVAAVVAFLCSDAAGYIT